MADGDDSQIAPADIRFGPALDAYEYTQNTSGITVARPIVSALNAADEVSIGRINGASPYTKFGYRENLTASAGEQTLWAASGNYTPSATAYTFDIAYDGTAGGSTDGASTTGALTLYFSYIDSNGSAAVASHTLGTDGSDTTSFSGYGINRVAVSSSGSNETNVSDITVTHTTGGATMAFIPAGQGVTQQCVYHAPIDADAVAHYLWWNFIKAAGGSATIDLKGYIWNRTVATRFEIFRLQLNTDVELTGSISEPVGFKLSPGDVLEFVADTSRDGVNVNLRFSLIEYMR